MKVALLSHRGGNIGHDFMAAGWEWIIRLGFGPDVEVSHYEQHQPFCVYPVRHPLRLVDRMPYGRLTWLKHALGSEAACTFFWPQSLPLQVDVAITCGGPNMVRGAGRSAEMRLMFHHQLGAFHARGVPVVDAAVGACYPLEAVPDAITDSADVAFFRRLFALTAASTVRDKVARRLWQPLGRDAHLIPCAASVSGRELERFGGPRRGEYVLINYQRVGANEDWGQQVDAGRWLECLKSVVGRLSRRHPVMFICHDAAEEALARKNFPNYPAHRPTTLAEYARVAMGARALLASRVHATIPMAGAGIPGVHIGTDTRIGTVELLGLPAYFVKRADAGELEAAVEDLVARRDDEARRLTELRERTAAMYKEVIQRVVETRA